MIVLLALFSALLARAVQREPDWSAACLGVGLIVVAVNLTCYYYGFLLAYGLLWNRAKLPGIFVTGLASLSCALAFVTPRHDEQFTAISLAAALTVTLITGWFAFRRAPSTQQVSCDPVV